MVTQDDIQIADIESQLAKLREAQESSSSTRACLFNLVVYAQEPRRIDYMRRLILAVIAKFPCRIIFIQGDSDAEASHLYVSVSSEIINRIACDQILIKVTEQHLHRVPFIVIPHLVPDLPVYLLWGQDPTKEDILLPHLMTSASRLIFDADTSDHLSVFSRHILTMMEEQPSLSFVDINWTLISGWRTILRQVFDNPTASRHLQYNTGVQIHYNDRKENWLRHNETQASYLSSWLASRLNWQLLSHESTNGMKKLKYSIGGKEFIVSLLPQTHTDLNPGTILAVEVETNDEHYYSIAPIQNLPKVTVHISGSDTCELPFTLPLPSLKPGFPFIRELFFEPAGSHYRKMLQTLSAQS